MKLACGLMDAEAQLSVLIELAESVSIFVRGIPPSAMGEQSGGALVRIKGREVIFLDPSASVTDQIDVLVSALAGREEIENRFVPPELRELMDRHRSRR